MTEADAFSFIKDYIWVPASALVGFFWKHNERQHEKLWEATEALRNHTSDGYSTLNDRVMEHIDGTVAEIKDENRRRIDKMDEHITKLFENAEKDRATFRDALDNYARRSEERHIELLQTIHVGLAQKADK